MSIGVQSFFNEDLQFMNRSHTANEALIALKHASTYFENITVDLIYGIPNLSTDKWRKNLQTVFDLGINHISSYALTVEHKTALYQFIKKKKIKPLDENLALNHFNTLLEETTKNNYIQYETSNFGKATYFSKHNSSYWLGKPYLGIGPAAHSFNGKQRSWNVRNNIQYIKRISKNELPQETELLSVNDLFNEQIMIGLRTIWGISLNEIEKKFGKEIKNKLQTSINKHIKNKTLIQVNERITATKKGMFLIDGIASDLFMV